MYITRLINIAVDVNNVARAVVVLTVGLKFEFLNQLSMSAHVGNDALNLEDVAGCVEALGRHMPLPYTPVGPVATAHAHASQK